MTITTSINTFITRAGGTIEVPQLPNNLIMNIIKLADGGKYTHDLKMVPVLQSIKQTGGWGKWHRFPSSAGPLEWLTSYEGGELFNGNDDIGISWENVKQNDPIWLNELLAAEKSAYYM